MSKSLMSPFASSPPPSVSPSLPRAMVGRRSQARLSHPTGVLCLLLMWAAAVARADEQPLTGGHREAGDTKQAEEKVEKSAKQSAAKRNEKKEAAKKDSPKKDGPKKAAAKETEKSNKGAQAGSKTPTAAPKPSEAEREQAAMALVREHHPDLVELLQRLKATKEKDYRQAVRELYRDSQRLENLRQRDQDRYELELRAWQLTSRIRLLTAKLSLEDRPELQEELKAALAEQADVRLAIRKLERDRLALRLSKLDEEIASLTSRREEGLKRSFDRLLNAASKARHVKDKAPGTKGGPTAKTEPTTTAEQTRGQGDKATRGTPRQNVSEHPAP
ncbi:MAG: hypothetical protein ACREHD_27275 [Pirellulales bacterium]